ncbi:MAG: WG repeat-containing protein [Ferruginibacter sp.]
MKQTNINKRNILLACMLSIGANVFAQTDWTLVPYRAGNKWGYVSENKEIVLAPRYADASWFSAGLAPVKLGTKWGYINRAGKMVIPAKYTSAKPFRKGYMPNGTSGGDSLLFAAVTLNNSGYEQCINIKGKVMSKCPAIPENSVPENRVPVATVSTQKTYNLPNSSGLFDKIIDDYKLDGSDETYYLAMKGDKYGVFNSKFETVVPFDYSDIKLMNSGNKRYLQVGRANMYGVYSPSGKQLLTPDYTKVVTVNGMNNNEYYIVQKDGKMYVKDGSNKDIIANGYADITYDDNGFIITDNNKLQGYYFLDNHTIAPRYKEIRMVNGGKYMLVKTASGKTGYIDLNGTEYFIE